MLTHQLKNTNSTSSAVANQSSGHETIQRAGEHTKNARPSTRAKHQKGQAAKKTASINSGFREAKKKDKNITMGQYKRKRKGK